MKEIQSIKIETSSEYRITENIFLFYLFIAFIGGLILNLMPCVFPVLSIKLMSVLENKNYSTRISFINTSMGIISSFLLLSVIFFILQQYNFAISWGMQFQQPYFLLVITFILMIFMLSMFDKFEFKTPKFLLSKFFYNSNSNRFFKDYFNGFFATLLATPCSAPFVGTAITAAFTQTPLMMFSIFFFMGVGMSIPYLIIAMFPNLVTILPKSGKWMIYLKYFLGLLLLLTILWISNINLNYFNYYFFIFLFLIFILLLYLINIKFNSFITSVSLLIILLVFSNFKFFHQNLTDTIDKNWINFIEVDIDHLVSENNIIFIDITADWCATCQFNKVNVLNNKSVTDLFIKNNIMLIRADWTKPNKQINDFLNKYNKFGIPFNAFFSKDYPSGLILSELLSEKEVLDVLNLIVK